MLRRSIIGSALRIGRGLPRTSQGWIRNSGIGAYLEPPFLSNLGVLSLSEIVTSPYALSFRSFIHSGKLTEDDIGRTPLSLDYGQGFSRERRVAGPNGRSPLFYQSQVESDADIVHIKLMRNNAFVTLTDSKGDKKIGVSAGKLAGDAAAEDIGRRLRQMKTRSVVVKVNGRCFFRRKKEAILALKDGYSNSVGDKNPIVYLEDTTRKPHNGCRLPKKLRNAVFDVCLHFMEMGIEAGRPSLLCVDCYCWTD